MDAGVEMCRLLQRWVSVGQLRLLLPVLTAAQLDLPKGARLISLQTY